MNKVSILPAYKIRNFTVEKKMHCDTDGSVRLVYLTVSSWFSVSCN